MTGKGVASAAVFAVAWATARRRLRERRGQPAPRASVGPAPERPPDPGDTLSWVSRDFLRFMRQIHGPIKTREIPMVLKRFIGSTFEPTSGVILIRRKPALSEPGRENQLVVVSSPGTRVARGSVIEMGEGDLGYVAKTRRAMDRRELDRACSEPQVVGLVEAEDRVRDGGHGGGDPIGG